MVDFHTHILYGMDDGAENLQTSSDLINSLINQGVNQIVLTPHFHFKNIPSDNFLAIRKKKVKELEKMYEGQNVRFIPGCEVYLPRAHLTDNLNKFAITGTSYILAELSSNKAFPKNFFDIINNIINYTGLTIIIAHAERYPAIRHIPEYITGLIECGCLIQMNTDSLFNNRTKRFAYKMLEKNQVHLLGSDCHNFDTRPPLYEKGVAEIIANFGIKYLLKLQQNMKDVLSNKPLIPEKVRPVRRIFNFYF